MGETLDSGRKGRLLESMGSMLCESCGGAFDLDINSEAGAEDTATQGNDAHLGIRRVSGAICSITMVAFGAWLLFNIALAITQSFGS